MSNRTLPHILTVSSLNPSAPPHTFVLNGPTKSKISEAASTIRELASILGVSTLALDWSIKPAAAVS